LFIAGDGDASHTNLTQYAPPVGKLLALREAVRAAPQYLTGLSMPFTWYSDNKPMVDSNASPSNIASPNATGGSRRRRKRCRIISHVCASCTSDRLPHAPDPRDLPPPSRSVSVTRLIDLVANLHSAALPGDALDLDSMLQSLMHTAISDARQRMRTQRSSTSTPQLNITSELERTRFATKVFCCGECTLRTSQQNFEKNDAKIFFKNKFHQTTSHYKTC
jgi:hypothetical protein